MLGVSSYRAPEAPGFRGFIRFGFGVQGLGGLGFRVSGLGLGLRV